MVSALWAPFFIFGPDSVIFAFFRPRAERANIWMEDGSAQSNGREGKKDIPHLSFNNNFGLWVDLFHRRKRARLSASKLAASQPWLNLRYIDLFRKHIARI